MTNYNNGKIYKLECLTTGLIYVGSTTKEYLSQRLTKHRSDYKKYLIGKMNYITSFKIIEGENFRIELLEQVNCNSKDELLAREGHYIRTLECVNKHTMGIGRIEVLKQYNERNKEKILLRNKQFYQDNKERIKEKQKKYNIENKENIHEKMKQYYEINKEIFQQKGKQYRETNKEHLNEKHICECGGKYTLSHKAMHLKTIKHLKYIDLQV